MTYPSYCCQRCGACIGWIGRALEWLLGPHHTCRPIQGYGTGDFMDNYR